VALGRALLSRPGLLLLDEPLASLDAARREDLLPWFEALRDRHSLPIVYVSHEFEEVVRLASHVVLLEQGRVAAQGEVGQVAMVPELRAILGPELVGSVVDGCVESIDPVTGVAHIRIGQSLITASGSGLANGQLVRFQILARDLIIATQKPAGLSVRNEIEGTIRAIVDDGRDAVLVEIDVGGPVLLARVTRTAAADLSLEPGRRVWALLKATTLRGRVHAHR
jgi:molybdate transport system ATP-binding protein